MKKYVLVLIFLLLATPCFATTYYICDTGATCGSGWVTGNDSNNGTAKATPYKTIQKFANVANPGDTGIVGDGTYTDSNSDDYIVIMTRDGSSGSVITFKAENKWGAVLDGQETAGYGFNIYGASYIRVEDFEIKDVRKTGISQNGSSGNYSTNNYMYRNKIHDVGRYNIDPCVNYADADIGRVGIGACASCTTQTIDSNVIYLIGRLPGGACALYAYFDYNHDHGLYIAADAVIVINNIFYDNLSGWAIQAYPSPIDNWKIINNTFYGTNPQRDGHIIISGSQSNWVIQNNIFHSPRNWAVQGTSSDDTSIIIRNNLVYGALIAETGDCDGVRWSCTNNIIGQNPLFTDLPNRDFTLLSASPAIDAGLSTDSPSVDYDGTARPQGTLYDIGAYEEILGVTPHNYYLSPLGGTTNCDSIATPCSMEWHNSWAPTAGDNYYLKSDETFTVPLTVQGSGTSGSRITYSKYGTGARPILYPVSTLTGWSGGGSWQTAWTLGVDAQTSDGATRNWRNVMPAGTSAYSGTKIRITVQHSSATEGSFIIPGASIGAMTTGDDYDASPTRITWDTGNNSVTITGSNTEKVSDEITFSFDKTKRHGIHLYTTSRYAKATTITNGYYYNAIASDQSQDQSYTGTLGSYVYGLKKVEVYVGSNYVYQLTQSTEPTAVTFDGVEGSNEAGACPGDLNADKEWCYTGTTLYIYDATNDPDNRNITRSVPYSIDINDKDYITVENVEVTGADTANVRMNGDYGILKKCTIAGGYSGVVSTGASNQIEYNLIYNNSYYGIEQNGGSLNLYNNVLHSNYDTGIYIHGTSTAVIKNNISSNNTTSAIKIIDNPTLTIDYNGYYPTAGTPFHWKTVDKNFADWKTACSCDSHSLNANPTYISASPTYNFKLSQTSTFWDKGVNLSLVSDYDSIPLWTGSAPDFGAFEMQYGQWINGIFMFCVPW